MEAGEGTLTQDLAPRQQCTDHSTLAALPNSVRQCLAPLPHDRQDIEVCQFPCNERCPALLHFTAVAKSEYSRLSRPVIDDLHPCKRPCFMCRQGNGEPVALTARQDPSQLPSSRLSVSHLKRPARTRNHLDTRTSISTLRRLARGLDTSYNDETVMKETDNPGPRVHLR